MALAQHNPPNERATPAPSAPGHVFATDIENGTRTLTCTCGWSVSEPENAKPVTVYRQALAHLRAAEPAADSEV